MGRPLLVDSNDQHRQKKKEGSLPLQIHLILSHLICYIHWLPRTIMTFREERATTGSEERESRALSSRRKHRVYTARAVVPNDWFFLLFLFQRVVTFSYLLRPARIFVRFFPGNPPASRIAESRDARPTESTFVKPIERVVDP